MADYRLHFIDGQNRIQDAVDLEAEDDQHALAAARDRRDGRKLELWQAGRRVHVFPPGGNQS